MFNTLTTADEVNFSFTPLNNHNGLYFERVAPVRLFNNEWRIVFHMNLSMLHDEFQTITSTIQAVEELCSHTQHHSIILTGDTIDINTNIVHNQHFSRQCGATVAQIKMLRTQLSNFNTNWFYHQHRNKRESFNVIGSLVRFLWNTLTMEDALKYLSSFLSMAKTKLDRQVDIQDHKTLLNSNDNSFYSMNTNQTESSHKVQDLFWTLRHVIHN